MVEIPKRRGRPPKAKPEDVSTGVSTGASTEEVPAPKGHTKWDFKPVWMGFIHPKKLGAKDKDGLPFGIPDTMGKEIEKFEALLDEFGAAGYVPFMQVEFRSGDAYLLFKREKVG